MAKSLGFTDATELSSALASEESFAPFYESLGTSQLQSLGLEYLTGLSNKNYRQMNQGTFLTPQSAGVAGVTGNAMPFQSSYNQFDIRQRNPDLIQI